MPQPDHFMTGASTRSALRSYYRSLRQRIQAQLPDKVDEILGYSVKRDDAKVLADIVLTIEPATILEIGSYCGISTGLLALLAPTATIDCIDPWLPTGDFEPYALFEALLGECLPRIRTVRAHLGCDCETVYTHATGADAPAPVVLPPRHHYDLVFIDGDHRTSSSVMYFMLTCKRTNCIVYHDAKLPQHQQAFDIIEHDYPGTWERRQYLEADGIAVFTRSSSGVRSHAHSLSA